MKVRKGLSTAVFQSYATSDPALSPMIRIRQDRKTGLVTFDFQYSGREMLTCELHDLCGRKVMALSEDGQKRSPGSACFTWNGSSLSRGIYLLFLRNGSGLQVKQAFVKNW